MADVLSDAIRTAETVRSSDTQVQVRLAGSRDMAPMR